MEKLEKDSDKIAWIAYKEVYDFLKNINLENGLEYKNNRLCYSKNGISYGGDCSFNFNKKKEEILRKLTINDKTLDDNLTKCCKNHYDISNFAIIPITGGMNNVKGKIKIKNNKIYIHQVGRLPNTALDRLDSFLCIIDDFYKIKKSNTIKLREMGIYYNNSIFSWSLKTENFVNLYDYLNEFNSVNEYAKKFYPWVEECLLNKMLEFGKINIDNSEKLKVYIGIVQEYWKSNENFRKKCICKNKMD